MGTDQVFSTLMQRCQDARYRQISAVDEESFARDCVFQRPSPGSGGSLAGRTLKATGTQYILTDL